MFSTCFYHRYNFVCNGTPYQVLARPLTIIVLLFIRNISSIVLKHLPVFCQSQIMRGYNILADILQMVVFSVFVCYFKVFEGEVQEI